MDLVERDKQLSVLDTLAAAARADRGQVALITGPTATGRTALLQAAAEELGSQGMMVMHAACAEAERSLACGVLSQLCHSAPLPSGPLARMTTLLAAATTRATGLAAAEQPDPELLQLFHALCLQLRELAVQQPLLITVDDVRHADPVSLAFLQQLIRRLRTNRIVVVLTDDTEPDPPHAVFRAELHRQPHLHRLAVGPLSHDGVYELLRRHFDEAQALDLTSEYYAATGGNPLLLHALITDPQPPAAGYGQAFASCLYRVEALVRQSAHALAVLGDDTRLIPVGALLDVEPEVVQRSLRAMDAAGLLDGGAFRHPAARTAVLDDIPAGVRAGLHRRAAVGLHEAGAPAAVIAAHLLESGRAAPTWAAPVLLEAAEHALAEDAIAHAASCLELALQAQPDPRAAAGIRARLCQAEWEMNPAAAARHLAPLLADLRSGRLERRDGITLVRQLLWHGRVEEVTAALELLRTGTTMPAEAAAELHDLERWLAYAHPPLARRRPVAPVPAGPEPTMVVTPLMDPWLPSAAELADALTRGQSQDGAARAHQVLRDLHLGRHTGWAEEAGLAAIGVLVRADQLEAAADWCGQLLGGEAHTRVPAWRAVLTAARAEVALAQGDLSGAAGHAQAALTHVAPNTWGVAVGLPLAGLVLACSRLGRFDEAGAHLAQPVPEAMFASRYGLYYLHARGQHHLATRHHHAALADFLSCGELIRGWGLDAAGIVPWRAGAAEAWLRLGNQDQARRLISDQLSRPGNNGARTRALSLRLLAAAGPAGRRPPLLLESLDLLEGCGDRFEQARSLADLASAYHALDENRRARIVFRRALHLAKICEADPLYRELLSVGNELGEGLTASGETDGLAVLTGSERRVAALAAIGYTNREIAGKLYITASTVEQHLTRVYRKLNVKHRRELTIDLTRRGGQASHA